MVGSKPNILNPYDIEKIKRLPKFSKISIKTVFFSEKNLNLVL